MTTGCSGQLCVSTDTGDVFTTCEYRPEYECLSSTECGPYGPGGSCAWDDTPEYLQCLDDVETHLLPGEKRHDAPRAEA